MKYKKLTYIIFLSCFFNLYIISWDFSKIEMPDLNSIANYAQSKIPTFDDVSKFIIEASTNNHELNLNQIPGFSYFKPYMTEPTYNFIGNLKIKDIKAEKDPETSTEIISSKTDIPVNGKNLETEVRIILGSHPVKEEPKKNITKQDWSNLYNYFDINNYISYVSNYVEELESIIEKWLASIEFGITIDLPKGFTFAEMNPNLSFLDLAKFDQAALAIGTKFKDPIYGEINPGVTAIMKLELQEPFTKINNFIKNVTSGAYGIKEKDIVLRGNILPSIFGSELKTNEKIANQTKIKLNPKPGARLASGPLKFKPSGTSKFKNIHVGAPVKNYVVKKTISPKKEEPTQSWGTFFFNLANKKVLEAHDWSIELISLPKDKENPYGAYAIGISAGLKLYLNNLNNKYPNLDFTGFFNVKTDFNANLRANMKGLLDLESIGLPLKFGNVTINQDFDLKNLKNLNLNKLELQADTNFGPKNNEVKLTSNIDIDFQNNETNIFAYGNLTSAEKGKEISLNDILNLSTTAYKQLEKDAEKFKQQIPEFKIKNSQFYFTPININYNKDQKLNSGVTLDAILDINGGTANLEFKLDETGFDGTGYTTSVINLGPISIVGPTEKAACLEIDTCSVGCNGSPTVKSEKILLPEQVKSNTNKSITLEDKSLPEILKNRTDFSKLKGGLVNIAFHPPKNILMLINARIRANNLAIGNIDSDACINISTNGINASFQQKLFNSFDSQITAYAKDYKNPDKWYLCAKMTPTGENALGEMVVEKIKKAKQEALEKINSAEKKVEETQKEYEAKLDQAKKDAEKAEKDMEERLNKAINECKS